MVIAASDRIQCIPKAPARACCPTALAGAAFPQLVDIAARTLDAPQELGLSIVTALFGVRFFWWRLTTASISPGSMGESCASPIRGVLLDATALADDDWLEAGQAAYPEHLAIAIF